MRAALGVLLCLVTASVLAEQGRPAGTLDIYQIDVEGGEATLFVSPSGESMLVDTGWPGFDGRDADRIAAVARQAGIQQIDYLVVTHFHTDHMGGVPELSTRLPIRHFVDHGSTVDQGERDKAAFLTYAAVRKKGIHLQAKPGDTIPIAGLNVQVVAAGGAVLKSPLAQAGAPNSFCTGFKFHGEEILKRYGNAEDDQSVSLFVSHGKFRTMIMGDLNWNKEYALMCPNNKVGQVDLYLVSHHGSDTSGSEAFVHALRPRVAVMNNGGRKGGAVQTFQILRRSPGLKDLWQNHYSIVGGQEYNAPERFIANLEEPGGSSAATSAQTPPVHMGPAHSIKVSARDDGSFTVTNTRNGHTKSYGAGDARGSSLQQDWGPQRGSRVGVETPASRLTAKPRAATSTTMGASIGNPRTIRNGRR
jgi:competence protein ComEC